MRKLSQLLPRLSAKSIFTALLALTLLGFGREAFAGYNLKVYPNENEPGNGTVVPVLAEISGAVTTMAVNPNGVYAFFGSDDFIVFRAVPNPGFSFLGWNYVSFDGNAADPDTSGDTITITTANKPGLLTANFSRLGYKLMFNADDAAKGEVSASVDNADVRSGQTLYYDTMVTLKATARAGFRFVRWSDGVTASTRKISITADATYTAVFEGISYTLSFNADGGSACTEQKVVYNTPYGSLPTPVRSGYTFVGWFDPGNARVTASTVVSIVGNHALTAGWAINACNYVLRASESTKGKVVGSPKSPVDYNTEVTLTATPNPGYSFVRWSDGSTEAVHKVIITGDDSYTAEFTEAIFDVAFDADGGTVPLASKTVTYAATYGELPVPTRSGYVFAGWFTAKNGVGEQITAYSKVTITGAHSLYAKWAANSYSITVAAGPGGSVTPVLSSVSKAYDSVVDFSASPANGYVFLRWSDFDRSISRQVTVRSNAVYSAVFSPRSFLVTFDACGGEPSSAVKTVWYNTTYGRLPADPVRAGYTFSGWYTGTGGSGSKVDSTTKITTIGAQVLYAKWTIDRLRFTYAAEDAAMGTVSAANRDGASISSGSSVDYGTSITLKANPKTGYRFVKWNDGSTSSSRTVVISAAIDYIAVFEPCTYALVFKANGGSCSVATTTVAYNSPYGLMPTPVRAGYSFVGWNTKEDGSGTTVVDSTTVRITAAQTLYAKWAINSYDVIIQSEDVYKGNVTPSINSRREYGTVLAISATARTGYVFSRWSDGSTEATRSVTISGNVTYTAYFDPENWSVAFDAAGGTMSETSLSVTYGQAYGELPRPVRAGYEFAGWYSEVAGGGNSIQATTLATDKFTCLYAKWTSHHYFVRFDANGGTGQMNAQRFSYDDNDIALTPVSFKRTGYVFAGWNTKADGSGKSYQDAEAVGKWTTDDAVEFSLYAMWTAQTYSVAFRPGDATATGEMADQEFAYGTAQQLSPNRFVNGILSFVRWSDGAGNHYTDGQSVSNLAVSGTVTLTAEWSKDYYVAFDGNGAESGSMTPQHFVRDADAVALKPNAFAKTGYTFGGWYDSLTDRTYVDTAPAVNLAAAGTTNVLTAVWSTNTYTIAFNANTPHASGRMPRIECFYDQSVSLPTNVYVNHVADFLGWSENAAATLPDYSDHAVVANLSAVNRAVCTLYAIWKSNLTDYSRAVGCENLVIESSRYYTAPKWTIEDGYVESGTVGSRDDGSLLTADIFGKGVLTFSWRCEGGSDEDFDFDDDSGHPTGHKPTSEWTELSISYDGVKSPCTAIWISHSQDGKIQVKEIRWNPSDNANFWVLDYNANGGSGAMSSLMVPFGSNTVLSVNGFSRDYHVFTGWNTESAGDGTDYAEGETLSPRNDDLTLYAQWRAAKFTVKFDGNGATSGTMSDQLFTCGVSQSLRANAFLRDGFRFVGWTLAGVPISDGAEISNLHTAFSELTRQDGAMVTLVANWNDNQYRFVFHGNGGTGSMSDLVANREVTSPLPACAFTFADHTFTGWNTKEDGSGTAFADREEISDRLGRIDLYAQWRDNRYRIVFMPNGGTGEMIPLDCAWNESVSLSDCTMTRSGYEFRGWATNWLGSAVYTDAQQVSELSRVDGATVRLFAVWGVDVSDLSLAVGCDNLRLFISGANNFPWTILDSGHGVGSNDLSGWSPGRLNAEIRGPGRLVFEWSLELAGGGVADDFEFDPGDGSAVKRFGSLSSPVEYEYTSGNVCTSSWYRISKTSDGSRLIINSMTWEPESGVYEIVFDANGGVGLMDPMYCNRDSVYNLTANVFTREGFVFAGWSCEETATPYEDRVLVVNLASSGTTVHMQAIWNPKP